MEAYYKRHLDKYAEEIASYAQNEHENYIAFMNERNYPSGEGIHMVDNYSIFRNALVLKAQEHVRGNKITEREALARIMERYMNVIGNDFKSMKTFYLPHVDMTSKGLTPKSTEEDIKKAQNISETEQIIRLNKAYEFILKEFGKDKKDTTNLKTLDDWKNFVCEEFSLAMFEANKYPNLFNTDCKGNLPFQILKTGYKENDPLKTFNFNFKDLIGTPYEQKIKAWCQQEGNNICEVFFLKGAWHEATHCRGTDDEYKTEAFAYLKMLQKFKEPALLETGFFGRANAALDRIEATRHEVHDRGIKTNSTNWTYQMIPLLNHLRKNAPKWVNDDNFLKMSNQDLMNMVIEISNNPKLRYSNDREEEFRNALNVDHKNLLPTLKAEAGKDGSIIGRILTDAMDFYNSYQPDTEKFQNINEFLDAKAYLFADETKQKETQSSKSEFNLSDEDKASYKKMYNEWKEKNPTADISEFCQVVIDENFEKIALIEAKYNEDGSLFFDKELCRKDSEQIRNILNHCQNAGEIVTLLTSQEKQSTRNISATGKYYGIPEGSPTIPQVEEVKFNPSHLARLKKGRA